MKESCLIIAGELSGEEHAQSFFPLLKEKCPDVHFWGVGGDYLASEGVELLYHLRDFSSWGITEVLSKLFFYRNALRKIEGEVKKRKCKKAILIDYQTFNLKLALKLKKSGVDILYYVAPQAWAWKEWRVPLLAKSIHSLFCLLPFEKNWFLDRGVSRVISVAHPLFKKHKKSLEKFKRGSKPPQKLLLLPGSRRNEIRHLLPPFLKIAEVLKERHSLEISLVKASSLDQEFFAPAEGVVTKFYEAFELEEALMENDLALASSGTVNLSCALFSLPTVVCYAGSLVEEFIFKNFVNYSGSISLANIIQGKKVFPEVLGDLVYSQLPLRYLESWIGDEVKRKDTIINLEKTQALMEGDPVDISDYMASVLKEKKK